MIKNRTMSLFHTHKDLLNQAITALHDRTFFAAYPEHPSPKIYGETADADGRKKFQGMMGNRFEELKQQGEHDWEGKEESPYLQQPLNISYPQFSVDTLIQNGSAAFHQWRKVSVNERAGVLIESLNRMKDRFFEIAYATMHTTGQGYMMAFQASGPHAADWALEAVAAG